MAASPLSLLFVLPFLFLLFSQSIVITYWQCASLVVYLTVMGSSTAAATTGLLAIQLAAQSGSLGYVLSVVPSTTPFPPAPTTTTSTYYYATTWPIGGGHAPFFFFFRTSLATFPLPRC